MEHGNSSGLFCFSLCWLQMGAPQSKKPGLSTGLLPEFNGVADGARTHDNRNHNPGLYQLSYSHHCLTFVSVFARQVPNYTNIPAGWQI
jgi:hypothetical protein